MYYFYLALIIYLLIGTFFVIRGFQYLNKEYPSVANKLYNSNYINFFVVYVVGSVLWLPILIESIIQTIATVCKIQ